MLLHLLDFFLNGFGDLFHDDFFDPLLEFLSLALNRLRHLLLDRFDYLLDNLVCQLLMDCLGDRDGFGLSRLFGDFRAHLCHASIPFSRTSSASTAVKPWIKEAMTPVQPV